MNMLQMVNRVLNRTCRQHFSDRRIKLDQEHKISKRWNYLLQKSQKESTLPLMKEYDVQATQEIKEQYRLGFTHEELEGENIMIRRSLSMNNTTHAEMMQHRINETIKKFQQFPTDTGSTQVQSAVLCERVIQGMLHMENNQQDTKGARHLIQQVSKRRKMLNCLKRENYHIYRWIIKEYGVQDINYPNHKEYFLHTFRFKGLRT